MRFGLDRAGCRNGQTGHNVTESAKRTTLCWPKVPRFVPSPDAQSAATGSKGVSLARLFLVDVGGVRTRLDGIAFERNEAFTQPFFVSTSSVRARARRG